LRGNDEIRLRAIGDGSVVHREWAAKNPRASFKTPITTNNLNAMPARETLFLITGTVGGPPAPGISLTSDHSASAE
jgi:hypothetical protein